MDTPITLREVFTIIIGIGLAVFVFYCVAAVRNLIPTLKSLAKIMKDAEVISGAAAEGAQGVHHVVENISESVSIISDLIKGNQSYVSAATNLVNAMAALRNMAVKKSDEETYKE